MRIKQLFLELRMLLKKRLFARTTEVTYTVEELLAGSSKDSLSLNKEDREWLNDKPVGREII